MEELTPGKEGEKSAHTYNIKLTSLILNSTNVEMSQLDNRATAQRSEDQPVQPDQTDRDTGTKPPYLGYAFFHTYHNNQSVTQNTTGNGDERVRANQEVYSIDIF